MWGEYRWHTCRVTAWYLVAAALLLVKLFTLSLVIGRPFYLVETGKKKKKQFLWLLSRFVTQSVVHRMFNWRSICLFAGWQALWWVMEHTDEQDKSFQNKCLPSHDDHFLAFPCSLQQWNCFVWKGERERDLGLIISRIFLNESRLGFNWMPWKVLFTLSSLLQHAWRYFVIVDTDPTVNFRSCCRSPSVKEHQGDLIWFLFLILLYFCSTTTIPLEDLH